MKLRAKIYQKYLDAILRGEKTEEFRQVESIVLTAPDGTDYEFEVHGIFQLSDVDVRNLQTRHPDLHFDDKIPTIRIGLGKRKP